MEYSSNIRDQKRGHSHKSAFNYGGNGNQTLLEFGTLLKDMNWSKSEINLLNPKSLKDSQKVPFPQGCLYLETTVVVEDHRTRIERHGGQVTQDENEENTEQLT